MNVLIIKNIATEGPGTIADFLKQKGVPYQIFNMFEPGEMPDILYFTHLVVLGGPMAVYEMDIFPFLRTEAAVIRSFINSGRPVLGICLGAQMIAHVLGARVYPGGTKEAGWYNVSLTPEGMEDAAVSALSVDKRPLAEVFQWHGDTFDLPEKAVRISSSEVYPNQAFRYENNVYALQFHIEVTPEIIREWFADEKAADIDNMIKKTGTVYPEYHRRTVKFYERFFA
ncbi:MAG: hypothetical protein OEU95_05955 [Nitrospirota bacterium]|nr:hypothetical protein [Nitrospirota bacterium]